MQKFEKKYQIRSYETDKTGTLRIVTLFNILQDMADLNANELGFGLDFCIKNTLAWFGTNYHLKINRLPKIHETIKIRTWPSGKKTLEAFRDFEVFDQNDEKLIEATSQWVLIDFKRKRPVLIDKYLSEFEGFEQPVTDTVFVKIPSLTHEEFSKVFSVRYDDIDINQHVNNAVYPLWALEALPEDFRDSHEISEIKIAYKKEGRLGEDISSLAEMFQDTQSLHLIKSLTDGRELAQLLISWK